MTNVIMLNYFRKYYIFLLFTVVVVYSCKKDNLITDPAAKLIFSTDTLTFDTVFTTTGSVTKYFKMLLGIFYNF